MHRCVHLLGVCVCMNPEQISVIFIFLSQLLHAGWLCIWGLGFSSHKDEGCHFRPPAMEHCPSTNKKWKMSAGQPKINCFCYCMSRSCIWRQPIIGSISISSCLLPLYPCECTFNFCALHWHLYSHFNLLLMHAASTVLFLDVFIQTQSLSGILAIFNTHPCYHKAVFYKLVCFTLAEGFKAVYSKSFYATCSSDGFSCFVRGIFISHL